MFETCDMITLMYYLSLSLYFIILHYLQSWESMKFFRLEERTQGTECLSVGFRMGICLFWKIQILKTGHIEIKLSEFIGSFWAFRQVNSMLCPLTKEVD